jgi:hypothetical protein
MKAMLQRITVQPLVLMRALFRPDLSASGHIIRYAIEATRYLTEGITIQAASGLPTGFSKSEQA